MKKENNIYDGITKQKWIDGYIKLNNHSIPKVSTKLTMRDTILNWFARWYINRMNYKIQEGLYAIGNPDKNSLVFVTANYKLTFDKLRKELVRINAWIVVLDTKGINVWCAAGKGTFGTQELLKRLYEVKLKEIVNHRKIILPQLGASGVSAHIIKKASGFTVLYGPINAKDIKSYINNNFIKTEKMKEMQFNFIDRLILVPGEFVSTLKYMLIMLGAIFIVNFIKYHGLNMNFFFDSIFIIGAILVGCIFVPLFLPFLPTRSFALKGFFIGLLWAIFTSIIIDGSVYYKISNILLLTPITSFVALNFTGASTYTSISGVKLEVKIASPIIIISLLIGIGLRIFIELNVI